MKRGALDLSVKVLFGVFIVIISLFIIFTISQQKSEFVVEQYKFDTLAFANNFLLAFLSSPECFTYVAEKQQPAQGVLDIYKLEDKDYAAKDLNCLDNFDFLYSFEVELYDSSKRFYGLDLKNSSMIENSLTIPINIVTRYNYTQRDVFTPARATMNAYFGQIPSFLGTLKKVCKKKQATTFKINTNKKISLDDTGIFCYGEECFDSNLDCNYSPFTIEPGDKILYLNIKNNAVEVS